MRIFVFLMAALTVSCGAFGQKKLKEKILLLDGIMLERYRSAKIDTNYVTRPPTRFTFSARANLAGQRFEVEGMDQGSHFYAKLRADYKKTLSVAANYLGLSVSLSLNPAKLLGRYRDTEVGLVYYGKQYGGDLIYQDAKNYSGYHIQEGYGKILLPPDQFHMRTLNASGYYVFNHRRFSYPAAMTQGYIQRRSAGSPLIALSAQAQRGELQGDYDIRLGITNIGLGGGYGYNYVPGRRWLIHLSALPTFIVYNHTSLTFETTKVPMKYHFPEVIITSRAAIVYQIKKNQFAALSGVYYFTDIGGKKHLDMQNTKWRGRLTYGFRL